MRALEWSSVAGLGVAQMVGWGAPNHIEADELRKSLAGVNADIAGPARSGQQQVGTGEVGSAGSRSAPQVHSLAEGLTGGEKHDGDLAAARVDPPLCATDPYPVRCNDAPCACDEVSPGRGVEEGQAS